jgi:hypothetical protein
MYASNLVGRNFRNPDEMELEEMIKYLSIEENENTSSQKQHCSLVNQITFSSPQDCYLRPSTVFGTFDNTHMTNNHNDINADSACYNEWKESGNMNKSLEHELKRNLLSHYQPNMNMSEALDTLGNLEVGKELHNKGTSNNLEDSLENQKLDGAPPSCHVSKAPYQHHKHSNNFLSVGMKCELLNDDSIPHNFNGISGPELPDVCSRLPMNSDTIQAYAQEVACADDVSSETLPVNKKAFSSNGTSCISDNLLPRSAKKESSIPISSSHESRESHTSNLKFSHYCSSAEVSDVKEDLANTDDNLKLELRSTEEETDSIKTSCTSSDFQSGCDKHACAHKLTPFQSYSNTKVANVKRVTVDCTAITDVENSKEKMSLVGNISCASYNFQSKTEQGSRSKHDSTRNKDARISMSNSSENCKSHGIDTLIKQSPTYRMISTRSRNIISGNLFYNLRKRGANLKVKEKTGSEQNDKKVIYCKKISGYNLRPRSAHTDKLTSGPEGNLFNRKPRKQYLQVKQISSSQVKNQSPFSTHISHGMYNLQPRNSPVSGSVHMEGPRICSSSLGMKCKAMNVDDDIMKQEIPECDNIFLSPTLNCEKNSLHSCRSNGVQVKLNTMTHCGCTQTENEIVMACANICSKTYNLRSRTHQGDCSKFRTLQHKKGTTSCSYDSSHSHKSDSAHNRKVRGVKQEAAICDVDMCSGVLCQMVGDIDVDIKLEGEGMNDKKVGPKFCGERSPYNLRRSCRNDLRNYKESNLYKNNCINSAKIVAAEDTKPRISVNSCLLREERQNLEGTASACNSMHVISEVVSSKRSVSYHLRSRSIVKETLQEDLSFRKDIKEEKVSEAENTLFETSKIMSGESIPIRSSENMKTEQSEQKLAGMKEIWPSSVDNPVFTKGIENLGNVSFLNDSKYACTTDSFSEDLEQELVAKCADVISSVARRCVIDINEADLDEICLRSGRRVQRNEESQKHFIFHNKSPELELLQNFQSQKSCTGQDEQALGDEKHSEEMDCFQSNIGASVSSGHEGSPNNDLTLSEKDQIDSVEHPGAHDENICGLSSQMNILSNDPLNDLGSSHAGKENIDNPDVFVTGLLGDSACNDNNAETAGTSEDTKKFPCNETSFMQDVNSAWQLTVSDTDGSLHKEEDLSHASDVNKTEDKELFQSDNIVIREQKLNCIDNTNVAKEQENVGDISYSQSHWDISKDLLNIEDDPKQNGKICKTDAVNFDVKGTSVIEISVPQNAINGYRNSDIREPAEVSLPEIGDAVTAEDCNMDDGPNTLHISAPKESLFIEDDQKKIHEATDSQDRNNSDVDMVELCMSVPMPKMSLVKWPVPGLGMHAFFIK